MPRQRKPRHCQCRFRGRAFKPAGTPLSELGHVVILRDELEALRLCDGDDLTQEEAGERMGVSRGTVQRILADARKKVARALSQGKAILFDDTLPKEVTR